MNGKWKKILLAGLAGIVVTGGLFGYFVYAQAADALKGVAKNGQLGDLLTPQSLRGESTGAVNVLIAGNSVDDANHGGADLTDSIAVVHFDLKTNKSSLISIPRDLYVNIAGTYQKINAAYEYGGLSELSSVVENVTGLTINHTALINYSAFKKMIDAVGGIDIHIQADDPRGIYDPMIGFSITNGVHHLNGTDALLLARCRNDPTDDGRVAYGLSKGDFDRTANQRTIANALLHKIESGQTLTNPNALISLANSLQGNVTTDLSIGQIRRVYDLVRKTTSAESLSLANTDTMTLLATYSSETAGDSLIPAAGIDDYTDIQHFITSSL